jgi:hypothetical protein
VRKRTTVKGAPWTLARASEIATEALGSPPKIDRIERHTARGPLVWSAIVPSALCLGVDRLGAEKWWAREKRRSGLLKWLLIQHGLRARAVQLSGRPTVHVVRLTSKEPDVGSAWEKLPVDCLVASWKRGKKSHKGIGFLVDDRPEVCDVRAWWEPGVHGHGCVVIRVYADPEFPDTQR